MILMQKRMNKEPKVADLPRLPGGETPREAEIRFSLIAEATGDGIWDWDLKTGICHMSPRYWEITGYPAEATVANWDFFRQLVPPQDWPVVDATINDHLLGKTPRFGAEYRIIGRDGKEKWIWIRGRVVERALDGSALRMVGTITDISDRKRAEHVLQQGKADLAETCDQRLNPFFQGATAGLALLDRDMRFVLVNDTLANMNGVAAKEHVGKTVREVVPQIAEAAEPFIRSVFSTDKAVLDIEFSGPTKVQPDVMRHWMVSYFPVGVEGSPEAVGAIVVELTRQKEAERCAKAALDYNQLLLQTSPVGILTCRATGEIVSANPAVNFMVGATPEELLRRNFRQFESWRRSGLLNLAEAALETGDVQRATISHMSKRGDNLWLSCQFVPFKHEGVPQLLGLLVDVTECKQMHEALEATNDQLRAMFEGARDAIFLADPETGIITDANEEAGRLLNFPKAAIIGRHQTELHPAEEAEEYQRLFREHRYQPRLFVEADVIRSDGHRIPVEISASKITLSSGSQLVQGIFRDVSERKQNEDQIRKLSRAVEQSPVSIVITNLGGNIEYVNPKFSQVTGYAREEVCGKNSRLLKSGEHPSSTYEALWGTITSGREWRGEFHNRKKNGDLFWEAAVISPIRGSNGVITHFLAVKEDITEKKLLEQKFLRAQRMESLGTLAIGIAHDLNNILAPVLMSTDYLRKLAVQPEDQEFLTLMHEGACRGADILRQLLIFGRGLEVKRSEIQVRSLLREIAKVIKETFPKTIRLETNFSQDLWTVCADPTQIHQAVLNLCVNARDAMPNGGVLTLVAENRTLDAGTAATIHDAKPGKNVAITVIDTGTGIAPEILDKIFDPFFTTKPPGKGTGLGLSTVLGIMKSHDGAVRVKSRLAEGTRVEIFLPAVECPDTQEICIAVESPPKAAGEYVLLVDDEEGVRIAGRRLLAAAGYRVLTARNGAEGLVKYSKRRAEIRAVVTDLAMPVMDGTALIQGLRRLSPEVRIIAISGLPDRPIEKAGPRPPVDGFIAKPFVAGQLVATLHQVLTRNEKNHIATSP